MRKRKDLKEKLRRCSSLLLALIMTATCIMPNLVTTTSVMAAEETSIWEDEVEDDSLDVNVTLMGASDTDETDVSEDSLSDDTSDETEDADDVYGDEEDTQDEDGMPSEDEGDLSEDTDPVTEDTDVENDSEENVDQDENADGEASDIVATLENEAYGVTMQVTRAALPEGVSADDLDIQVKELTNKEVKNYLALLEKEKDELIQALDISLINKATGEEIQPSAGVSITMNDVKDLPDTAEVYRIDDAKNYTELENTVDADSEEVVFETEHFTPFVVVAGSTEKTEFTTVAQLQAYLNEHEGETLEVTLDENPTEYNGGTIRGLWFGSTPLVISGGTNVTFKGTCELQRKPDYMGDGCSGTMIRVTDESTLTLEEGITFKGDGHSYSGADEQGVFITVEAKSTLNIEGANFTWAHTRSNENRSSYIAPIVAKGSDAKINFVSGTISDTHFYLGANGTDEIANDGGNPYSSGGILVLAGAELTMEKGATIKDNNAGYSDDYRDFDDITAAMAYAINNGHPEAATKNATFTIDSKRNITTSGGTTVARTTSAGAVMVLGTDSKMTMNGGTISNNKGETGGVAIGGVSANLDNKDGTTSDYYGQSASFVMVEGTITENTGVSTGGVYVGKNASMTMGTEGASDNLTVISNNKGSTDDAGGGVTVTNPDGKRNENESDEEFHKKDGTFTMNSGTISGNHSHQKGGGIRVASNNVHLIGGTISNNQGDVMGGGIYVDNGNDLIFENLADITGNTADETIAGSHTTDSSTADWEYDHLKSRYGLGGGGGIWVCPEGVSEFKNLGMLLVHDNTASAAGDDFYNVVYNNFVKNKKVALMELPSRDINGAKILWYRDGGLTPNDSNAFEDADNTTLQGITLPSGNEVTPYEQYKRFGIGTGVETEFTKQINKYDAFAVTMVPESAETLAAAQAKAKIFITGNTSGRGGGIGSDGHLYFGNTENYEGYDLTVKKSWEAGMSQKDIEIEAYVVLSDGSEQHLDTISLTKDNNYEAELSGLQENDAEGNPIFTKDLSDGSEDGIANTRIKLRELNQDSTTEFSQGTIKRVTVKTKTEDQDATNYNSAFKVTTYHYIYEVDVENNTTENKKPVKIRKSALTGESSQINYLAGATLRIVEGSDATGSVVSEATWVTGEDLETIELVVDKTYTLVELSAPTGYMIADPITFTVKSDGKVYTIDKDGNETLANDKTITMYDKPASISIDVQKKWEDSATPEAITVYLVDQNGNEVTKDADGNTIDTRVELNKSNGWYYRWNLNLLTGDNYSYSVVEVQSATNPKWTATSYEKGATSSWELYEETEGDEKGKTTTPENGTSPYTSFIIYNAEEGWALYNPNTAAYTPGGDTDETAVNGSFVYLEKRSVEIDDDGNLIIPKEDEAGFLWQRRGRADNWKLRSMAAGDSEHWFMAAVNGKPAVMALSSTYYKGGDNNLSSIFWANSAEKDTQNGRIYVGKQGNDWDNARFITTDSSGNLTLTSAYSATEGTDFDFYTFKQDNEPTTTTEQTVYGLNVYTLLNDQWFVLSTSDGQALYNSNPTSAESELQLKAVEMDYVKQSVVLPSGEEDQYLWKVWKDEENDQYRLVNKASSNNTTNEGWTVKLKNNKFVLSKGSDTLSHVGFDVTGMTIGGEWLTKDLTVGSSAGRLLLGVYTDSGKTKTTETTDYSETHIILKNKSNPTYKSKVVEVQKKWDGSFTDSEKAIFVQLYKNGEAVSGEKVLLNKSNNWYYKWTGLDEEGNYTVDEIIPSGKENVWSRVVEKVSDDDATVVAATSQVDTRYTLWYASSAGITSMGSREFLIITNVDGKLKALYNPETVTDNVGIYLQFVDISTDSDGKILLPTSNADRYIWKTTSGWGGGTYLQNKASGFSTEKNDWYSYLLHARDGKLILATNDGSSGSLSVSANESLIALNASGISGNIAVDSSGNAIYNSSGVDFTLYLGGETAYITAQQSLSSYEITNTKETVDVSVTKTWSSELADKKEAVTVQLYKDGSIVAGKKATLSAPDWTYKWTGLDADGTYTVQEIIPTGKTWTASVSVELQEVTTVLEEGSKESQEFILMTEDGYAVYNTMMKDGNGNYLLGTKKLETTTKTVGENTETIYLLSEEEQDAFTWKAIKAEDGNSIYLKNAATGYDSNWSATNVDGQAVLTNANTAITLGSYIYINANGEITCEPQTGYKNFNKYMTATQNFNIKNTDKSIKIDVEKIWDDSLKGTADAADEVTVQLLKDGKIYSTVKLNADNDWKHEWTGLVDDGVYSVNEVIPDDKKNVWDKPSYKETQTTDASGKVTERHFTVTNQKKFSGVLPFTGGKAWKFLIGIIIAGIILSGVWLAYRNRKWFFRTVK